MEFQMHSRLPSISKRAAHLTAALVAARLGKRTYCMRRNNIRLIFSICIILAGAGFTRASEPDRNSKELLQFIKDARHMGLADDAIQRGAINAGWTETVVRQALSAVPRSAPGPLSPTAELAANVPADYRIGSGDVLQVIVWKEPEASVPGVVVRPDGKITLPLLKEVHVSGFSPADLEKLLTPKYQKFIPDADVTVVPKEINSRKVYMVGGVRKEGALLLSRSMTVLQAITEAGGLSDYARK